MAIGSVAGAITALILAALNYGDWSAVDWTTVAAAFTFLLQQGVAYLLPTAAKEAVSGAAGAAAVLIVALLQWALLGTPFDVASYGAAITAIVTFAFNVIIPRVQPVT